MSPATKNPESRKEVPLFTRQEVLQHGFPEDLWVVVHNQVFDVTSFCDEHPGGFEILLEWGGMDATEAFESKGHSRHAYLLLSKFYIGEIVAEQRVGEDSPLISSETTVSLEYRNLRV